MQVLQYSRHLLNEETQFHYPQACLNLISLCRMDIPVVIETLQDWKEAISVLYDDLPCDG